MNEPPRFNSENQSLERYLRSFNDYLNYWRLELKDAVRLLPLVLDEESRAAYENIPEEIRKSGPWETLVTELQDRIYTNDKKQLARQQLFSCCQLPSENVAAFARKCVILSQKCYLGKSQEKERETVLLASFLKGLQPSLARAAFQSKAENFFDAKLAAEEEEALLLLYPNFSPDNVDLEPILKSINSILQKERILDSQPEDQHRSEECSSDEQSNNEESEESSIESEESEELENSEGSEETVSESDGTDEESEDSDGSYGSDASQDAMDQPCR